ncbi:MAG: nucleotidyltransferase family protein [Phormidesmis sp.]
MDAIVLVGGLGTRLRSLITDVPKPMAPVGGVPFLDILLEKLLAHSMIDRVILAVGYKRNVVQEYFGDRAYNRKIVYAVEKSPLGTGGGILNALAHTRSQEVLVLNGDTLFDVNIHDMVEGHRQRNAELTLALKPMRDFSRYGTVRLNNNRIVGFEEKQYQSEGLINGGVYLLNQTLFDGLPQALPHRFSFESDFLEVYLQQLNVYGFISSGYFIDIGIPEDYRRAQQELSKSRYAQTA